MLVKECMTKMVELGHPEMSIEEVAMKMREGDFGALPIAENDRLIGMITDRDIVVRCVAAGRDPQRTEARDIMTHGTMYCYEDELLADVAENMGEIQRRRLPVLNREKRLVGIVSLGDLAVSEPEHIGRPVARISEHVDRQPYMN